MSNASIAHSLSPNYKLFFDDIEAIFLNTIPSTILNLSTSFACFFLIGIFILLINRPKDFLISCLIPFIYTLVFYDFLQLLSLVFLKYYLTERFLPQTCQWTYYLKTSTEAGQSLTIIFLFAISRHQIRYFLTHNHLPNSSRIHSRALTFVCLLFIVYANNWITHLKVEKMHLITLNETKYEINIEELPISLYDLSNVQIQTHQRFLTDLERYSRGQEKTLFRTNISKSHNDQIIHSHHNDHQIVIKFPFNSLFNPNNNQSKQQTTEEKKNSYRINRCTYGQANYFLSNFLLFIHSLSYTILIIFYIITIPTYKLSNLTINSQKKSYEKSLALGRRKSADRHKQQLLLVHLKHFLYLILYSHSVLTFIRLIYNCSLILMLYFASTPFHWLPMKVLFYSLFLISYFSIPFRMSLVFFYLFFHQFALHIQSIILYVFHSKLRLRWKFQKPTICFRFQFIPYMNQLSQDENFSPISPIDMSSTIDEDQSHTIIQHESIIVYDESSTSHSHLTTNILHPPFLFVNQSTSNIAKL